MEIKFHKQQTDHTCGPACMKMILEANGIKKYESWLAEAMKTNPERGTRIREFCPMARRLGLKSRSKQNSNIREIKSLLKKYFIIVCYYYAPEDTGHFAVVKHISSGKIFLIDPWCGPNHNIRLEEFKKLWHSTHENGMNKRWFCAIENLHMKK